MNFLELTNHLRNRFNEVELTDITWSSVVGFDQFSKDAINYAYHDILNAEMEWPFLHNKGSLLTVPGVQFYPIATGNSGILKEIDWDSFFIAPNDVVTSIVNEAKTISSTLIVIPTNIATWNSDLGVTYTTSGIALQPVDRDPAVGQYTISAGNYYFNVADVGKAIKLNYRTASTSTINVDTAGPLKYIDYDLWRQTRLQVDLNNIVSGSFSKPYAVFKTQDLGEIGVTPVPDKIYIIDFEYWVDTYDMVDTGDVPAVPSRFHQVILDGAAKYCYEFREDPPAAAQAEKKFTAGIARMRIELVNRDSTMRSNFTWRKHGSGFTL